MKLVKMRWGKPYCPDPCCKELHDYEITQHLVQDKKGFLVWTCAECGQECTNDKSRVDEK